MSTYKFNVNIKKLLSTQTHDYPHKDAKFAHIAYVLIINIETPILIELSTDRNAINFKIYIKLLYK